MTVTQMESAAQEIMRSFAGNPVGRFLRRDDLHHAAIVTLQQVVIAKHCTPLSKNGDFLS
jgi:hypothetical protein